MDLNLLYGAAMPPLAPCPFCGKAIRLCCEGDAIFFKCDPDSHCFAYSIQIVCWPPDFRAAVDSWNRRPLEIRARMAAINEAATIAGNWNGRRVNSGYAIKTAILDLKRQPEAPKS